MLACINFLSMVLRLQEIFIAIQLKYVFFSFAHSALKNLTSETNQTVNLHHIVIEVGN